MELDDSLFRIAPEPFKTVDVDLPSGKPLSMIDSEMSVSTEHERIIASESIGIHNRASSYGFNGMVEDFLCGNVSQYLNLYHPVPLKNAEHRYLASRSSPSFPFASSPKVCFIGFNFPFKKHLTISTVCGYSHTDDLEGLKHSGIRYPHLQRGFPGRDLQFKELYDPQPVLTGDIEFSNPSASEVPKLIPALATTIPSSPDPIGFSATTPGAENMTIFSTPLYKKSLSRFFSLYKNFKRFYLHSTTISWWQRFYNYLFKND